MVEYKKSRPETIQSMFGSIAENYDRTNAILSFQLHRYWNRQLIKETAPQAGSKANMADLCCGTGAISLAWLASQKIPQQAYLIDFCQQMLDCAQGKALSKQLTAQHQINYLQADVQKIPLENSTIDFATMAYGIRNVASPERCFDEVFRILKEGSTFGILELTTPENSFLHLAHKAYLRFALPVIGKIFARNHEAYRYLSQSIQAFIKPLEIKELLKQAGFASVEVKPLTGGIVTLLIARK